MSKHQPGTVRKNSSTVGPPAGIEPTPLRCRCNPLTIELRTTFSSFCRTTHESCKLSKSKLLISSFNYNSCNFRLILGLLADVYSP